MFGIENYFGFIIAAIILNLTPGVDTIHILTRSVYQGKAAGFISVAGIMSGCVIHVFLTAFGLSAILSTSAFIFSLVKWAGAIYLIYLGIKALLEKPLSFNAAPPESPDSNIFNPGKIYRQGVLTNVLNPKVALFFLSFLPQFIDTAHVNGPLPFLILGGTFLVTGTLWCLMISFSAASMTKTLRDNEITGLILQKLSGIIFIGFGLKLIFMENPA
jgi:threonine/homoserine/homoserine lactone efflux protein